MGLGGLIPLQGLAPPPAPVVPEEPAAAGDALSQINPLQRRRLAKKAQAVAGPLVPQAPGSDPVASTPIPPDKAARWRKMIQQDGEADDAIDEMEAEGILPKGYADKRTARASKDAPVSFSLRQKARLISPKTATDTSGKELFEGAVPFLGTGHQILDLYHQHESAQRVLDGTASPEDEQVVTDSVVDIARGGTFWGNSVRIATSALGWAGEMGLTGGVGPVAKGMAGAGKAGAAAATKAALFAIARNPKVAAEMLAKSEGQAAEYAARRAVVSFAEKTGKVLGQEAVRTAAMPQLVVRGALQQIMPDVTLTQDDQGNLAAAFRGSADSFMSALPSSALSALIETVSERTGGFFNKVPPLSWTHALQAKVAESWLKRHAGSTATDFLREIAKKTEWHGPVAEWLEEIAGNAMHAAAGQSPWDAVIPPLQQNLEMLTGFALPTAVGTAIGALAPGKKPAVAAPEAPGGDQVAGAVTAPAAEQPSPIGAGSAQGETTPPAAAGPPPGTLEAAAEKFPVATKGNKVAAVRPADGPLAEAAASLGIHLGLVKLEQPENDTEGVFEPTAPATADGKRVVLINEDVAVREGAEPDLLDRILRHEASHVLKVKDPQAHKDLDTDIKAAIEGAVPGFVGKLRDAIVRTRPELGKPERQDELDEEVQAYLQGQKLGGWVGAAFTAPDLVLEATKHRPGMWGKIVSAIADVLHAVGLRKSPSARRIGLELKRMVAHSDLEQALTPEFAAQLALRIREGYSSLLAEALQAPSSVASSSASSASVTQPEVPGEVPGAAGQVAGGTAAVHAAQEPAAPLQRTVRLTKQAAAFEAQAAALEAQAEALEVKPGGPASLRRGQHVRNQRAKQLRRQAAGLREQSVTLQRQASFAAPKAVGDRVRLPDGREGEVKGVVDDRLRVRVPRVPGKDETPEEAARGLTEYVEVPARRAELLSRPAPAEPVTPSKQAASVAAPPSPAAAPERPMADRQREIALQFLRLARKQTHYMGHKSEFFRENAEWLARSLDLKGAKTIFDLYAGGGTYGLTFALSGIAPDANRIVINEIDPIRRHKFDLSRRIGGDVLDPWETSPLLRELKTLIQSLVASEDSTSPAALALDVVTGTETPKAHASFVQFRDRYRALSLDEKAALLAFRDVMFSGRTATFEKLWENAKQDANNVQAHVKAAERRGIKVEVVSLDATGQEAVDLVKKAGRSFVILDPPYFGTSSGNYSAGGKTYDFKSKGFLDRNLEAAKAMSAGNALLYNNSGVPEVRDAALATFGPTMQTRAWERQKRADKAPQAEFLGVIDHGPRKSVRLGRVVGGLRVVGRDGEAGAERRVLGAAGQNARGPAGARPVGAALRDRRLAAAASQRLSRKLDALGFYSRLEEAAEKLPENLSALSAISKLSAGVSKEELRYSGILDFLKGKAKVSREEILDHLRVHGVKLREIEHAEGETQFGGRWVLTGGENYRELLLTLPSREYNAQVRAYAKRHGIDTLEEAYDRFGPPQGDMKDFRGQHFGEPNVLVHMRVTDRTVSVQRTKNPVSGDLSGITARIMEAVPLAKTPGSLGSGAPAVAVKKGLITPHEAGVWSKALGMVNEYADLPSVRDKRVLFIEEIQSDWHQKGLKKGYHQPTQSPITDEENERIAHLISPYSGRIEHTTKKQREESNLSAADEATVREYLEWYHKPDLATGAVPDAPFKQSSEWYTLAMKRLVYMAATQGYDIIGWTTGAQQIDRYDEAMRRNVDKIEVAPSEQRDADRFKAKKRREGSWGVWDSRNGDWTDSAMYGDLAAKSSAKRMNREWIEAPELHARQFRVEELTAPDDEAIEAQDIAGPFAVMVRTADPMRFGGWGDWHVFSDGFEDEESATRTMRAMEDSDAEGETPTVTGASVYVRAHKDDVEQFGARVPLEGTTSIHGHEVDLEDVIGKELASKVRAAPGETHVFEGEGLSIGGKGLKQEYDVDLVNIAKKLTGETPVDAQIKVGRTKQTIHTVAVPEKANEGFSRFSKRLVDTPAFRRWFGDSKVVDADGKPLVVYHGTNKDFSTHRSVEDGIVGWFSEDPLVANAYSNLPIINGKTFQVSHRTEGGNVRPVYLSIRNPYTGPLPYHVPSLIDQGYDGALYDGMGGKPGERTWIVFRSTQIKSATGNTGAFDPSNPDIRRSKRLTKSDLLAMAENYGKAPDDMIARQSPYREVRAQQAGVRAVRAEYQRVIPRSEQRDKAEALIESLGGLEKAGKSLVAKYEETRALEAHEHVALGMYRDLKGEQALQKGTLEAFKAAGRAEWDYEDVRAGAGRALGVQQDATSVMDPGTGKQRLARLLSLPSRASRAKLDRLYRQLVEAKDDASRKSVQLEIDKVLGDEAALNVKAVAALKRAGYSAATLTADYFHDPVAFGRMARIASTAKASPKDWFLEWRYSSMLGGPATHIRNISGNAGNLALAGFVNRLAEGIVNIALKDEKSATIGETLSSVRHAIPVLMQAGHNFLVSMQTGLPAFEFELAKRGVKGSKLAGKEDIFSVSRAAIPGPIGVLMRKPSLDLLTAADEFFKTLAFGLEGHALAYRQAKKEGAKDIDARIGEILSHPEGTIWNEALLFGRKMTFQDSDSVFLRHLYGIRSAVDETFRVPLGTILVPFIATPFRIFQAALSVPASPFVLIHRAVWGGYKGGKHRVAEDVGASLVGIGITLAVIYAVSGGGDDDGDELPWLTGSAPPSTGGRELMQRTNPPQSFRAGGAYHSFAGLDPIATMLTTIIDLHKGALKAAEGRGADQVVEALGGAVTGFLDAAADKTFFRALGDLYKVVSEPDSGRWIRWGRDTFVTPMLPNVVRAPARAADEFQRANTVREYENRGKLESAARSLSYEALPLPGRATEPSYALWGQPVERPGRSYLGRLAGLFPTTGEVRDISDLDLAIQRFNTKVRDGLVPDVEDPYLPTMPAKSYKAQGVQHFWDDPQYGYLCREAGQLSAKALLQMADAGELNIADPGPADIALMRKTISRARREVKAELLLQPVGSTEEDQ